MLFHINRENYLNYIDDAYKLSQSLHTSGFPVFCDGVKTKDDFFKWVITSFDRVNEYIVGFLSKDDKFSGWLHYFTTHNEIAVCTLLFDNGDEDNLLQLFDYLKEKHPSHLFNLYVPHQNEYLYQFLKEQKFKIIDESFVDVLDLSKCEPLNVTTNIISITANNFYLLENYRNECTNDYFYSSSDFLMNIERWTILGYRDNDKVVGIIYYKKSDLLSEIFGLEIHDSLLNAQSVIAKELVSATISDCVDFNSKFLYFFSDSFEHNLSRGVGFTNLTRAICFSGRL